MMRGEIWWCDFHAFGRRPALILTRDTVIPLRTDVVVAAVTRRIRGIPTEVQLTDADGVPAESAISFDNIYTVSKRQLLTRITKLSGDRLDEVCEALRFAFAC